MALNIWFSETWGPLDASAIEAQCAERDFCVGGLGEISELRDNWPVYTSDIDPAAWPTTDIPILTLNGTFDHRTPLHLARIIETEMTGEDQVFAAFPYTGHNVIGNAPTDVFGADCGLELTVAFVERLGRGLKDSPAWGCLDNLLPYDFESEANAIPFLFDVDDAWDPGAASETEAGGGLFTLRATVPGSESGAKLPRQVRRWLQGARAPTF